MIAQTVLLLRKFYTSCSWKSNNWSDARKIYDDSHGAIHENPTGKRWNAIPRAADRQAFASR